MKYAIARRLNPPKTIRPLLTTPGLSRSIALSASVAVAWIVEFVTVEFVFGSTCVSFNFELLSEKHFFFLIKDWNTKKGLVTG